MMQILRNIILLPVVENTSYTNYSTIIMYQMTVRLYHHTPLHCSDCSIATSVQGMYPTIIIVLVTIQKSHLESQFTYPGRPEEYSDAGRLAFASRPPNGSTERVTAIRGMTFVQSLPDDSSRSLTDSAEKTDGTQTLEKVA